MKNGLWMVIVATAMFTTPIQASTGQVYVKHGGQEQRIGDINFKAMSVCALKARLARMFSLDPGKFDVTKESGLVLNEDLTLEGDNVSRGSMLYIRKTSYSRQCD